MDRRRQFDLAANNGLQTGFLAVRHDLGVNAPVALVDAEDDGLAARPAPALAAYTARAEVDFRRVRPRPRRAIRARSARRRPAESTSDNG